MIGANGREYVTLESRKHGEQGWYLTLVNGKFRGSVPVNGNERFETVSLDSAIALKATISNATVTGGEVRDYTNNTNAPTNSTSGSGSGSGSSSGSGSGVEFKDTGNSTDRHPPSQKPPIQDCYLGFAVDTGRPSCYNSTNYLEIRLLFIDSVTGG